MMIEAPEGFFEYKAANPNEFNDSDPIYRQMNVYAAMKARRERVKTEQELKVYSLDREAQRNSERQIEARILPLKKEVEVKQTTISDGEEFARRFNKECEDAAIKEGTLKPKPFEETPSFIIEGKDKYGNYNGKKVFDLMVLSDWLAKEFGAVKFKDGLYVYNPITGMFSCNTNVIETKIRDLTKEHGISSGLTSTQREALTHLKSMGEVERYPFVGPFGCIHVKNGSLNLETGELTPTTMDHKYDYRIETEYEVFEETPELDEFFETYGTSEAIDVLAKCIWQRAFHDVLKELTVLYGPKDSGKTTELELVQVTIDGNLDYKVGVGRALLHDLLQRFGLAGLEGKLLNYGDDLPDMFVRNSSALNTLVGSIVQRIERKGVDGYDAIVTAYYCFSANNLPPLDDDDNVIWAKIKLVEFKKTIPPEKRIPKEKLFTETLRKQLLFRAVEKAKEWAHKPYVKEQDAEEIRRLWHEASTDVDLFMLEALTADYLEVDKFNQPVLTSLDTIKKHYDEWCAYNHKTRHIKYLQKALKPHWRRSKTNNAYAVKCIPYKKEDTAEQKTIACGTAKA